MEMCYVFQAGVLEERKSSFFLRYFDLKRLFDRIKNVSQENISHINEDSRFFPVSRLNI